LSQSAGSADLLDTLASMKAAADAAISRAVAESDAKRVETLKHLQTMMRGYDLALTRIPGQWFSLCKAARKVSAG